MTYVAEALVTKGWNREDCKTPLTKNQHPSTGDVIFYKSSKGPETGVYGHRDGEGFILGFYVEVWNGSHETPPLGVNDLSVKRFVTPLFILSAGIL